MCVLVYVLVGLLCRADSFDGCAFSEDICCRSSSVLHVVSDPHGTFGRFQDW